MAWATVYLESLWAILLDLAPWLLLGLVAAGLIKALVPMEMVARWLGGRGVGAVLRAAILGAPLPLCSCSVLPAAASLRRQGASRGATASFLVSTPETGVDSLAVSYALLGPFMMAARLVSSIVTAVCVGLMVETTGGGAQSDAPPAEASCCGSSACCGSAAPQETQRKPLAHRLAEGLRYSVGSLLDDLLVWLVVGVLAAAAVDAFVPRDLMASWGSGLLPMVGMLLIGVPMYICASASTPLAAALMAAGVSPGTALVFLLAGPATNVATLGVLRRELGNSAAWVYLATLSVCTIGLGLTTDAVVSWWAIPVHAQVEAGSEELMPAWIAVPSLVVLAVCAIRPLRRRLPWVGVRETSGGDAHGTQGVHGAGVEGAG